MTWLLRHVQLRCEGFSSTALAVVLPSWLAIETKTLHPATACLDRSDMFALGREAAPGRPGGVVQRTLDTAALVRFVLARLDEDNSTLHKRSRRPVPTDGYLADDHAVGSVDRQLAECTAKRCSVAAIQRLLVLRDLPNEQAVRHEAAILLRALALPYAGHPTYRTEWSMRGF